jgi:hypothetical protein
MWVPSSKRVPKLQIVTVDRLFTAHPIDLPGLLDPPEIGRAISQPSQKRARKKIEGQTEMLFALENPQAAYEAEKPRRHNRQIRDVVIEVMRPDTFRRKTK